MVDSYYLNNDYPWWPTYYRSRLCLCSLYLYHFLKMYILGISAYYHDSAACIIKNGEIIAAAQEERFTRKKHDHSFPQNSIIYCLKEAKISPLDLHDVVFYEKPFIKFERLIETYLAFAPKGFKSFKNFLPIWVKDKLFLKYNLIKEFNKIDENVKWKEKLLFSEHHLSHAASAFYPSPFKNAAVLTLDGVGEWATTSLAIGKDNKLDVIKEIFFPHSIGLLYSAFTYYLGFKVNSGEYKMMGLAPYGEPKYTNLIKDNLVCIAPDGSFQLDMAYFNFATGLTMTNEKFNSLFGGAPRQAETDITQKHMDIAASIQNVTEEIMVKLVTNISRETNEENLCLAGGVALNCVANGILLKKNIFKNMFIQPAAGDAGGALGAALATWHLHYNNERSVSDTDDMRGAYLGPKYSSNQICQTLNKCRANFHELDKRQIIKKIVDGICEQKAIGLMQGRMEFGPRALGSRSIIADPRSSTMQKKLNLKIKFRESFRPFAPSVLDEYKHEWFELNQKSPYMLLVAHVKENKRKFENSNNYLFGIDKLNQIRSEIPAVTHVDYSARIQTVHENTNPVYYSIIKEFYNRTNCPVVINTSFNVRGEPIVCSPEDAFRCFMGTNLDILVIENYILFKEEQDSSLKKEYLNMYELD